MPNNSKITYRLYEVSTTTPDGILLKGELYYWAKDYTLCLTIPFKSESRGHHLQLAVPVVYATDEAPRKGVHYIDLIERAKELLIDIYEGKEQCSL